MSTTNAPETRRQPVEDRCDVGNMMDSRYVLLGHTSSEVSELHVPCNATCAATRAITTSTRTGSTTQPAASVCLVMSNIAFNFYFSFYFSRNACMLVINDTFMTSIWLISENYKVDLILRI